MVGKCPLGWDETSYHLLVGPVWGRGPGTMYPGHPGRRVRLPGNKFYFANGTLSPQTRRDSGNNLWTRSKNVSVRVHTSPHSQRDMQRRLSSSSPHGSTRVHIRREPLGLCSRAPHLDTQTRAEPAMVRNFRRHGEALSLIFRFFVAKMK